MSGYHLQQSPSLSAVSAPPEVEEKRELRRSAGSEHDLEQPLPAAAPAAAPAAPAVAEARRRRHSTVDESEPDRVVELREGRVQLPRGEGGEEEPFVDNEVRTSKYTVWTFLPRNLYEQLTRPANLYFVFIAILQAVPAVSISQGKPTILLPLILVLTVSGVKDAFEDSKRHKEDREENEREYDVLDVSTRRWVRRQSRAIRVGDWVRVHDDETYPADLLMAHASAKGGYSYVETANLDGETNLKIKMVPKPLRGLATAEDLAACSMRLQCDPPAGALDAYGGNVSCGGSATSVVGLDNLLLRGSRLRNTGHIYGLAVYTGPESKIRMNSSDRSRTKVKRSSVERRMNRQIVGMFVAQVCVCFVAALGAGIWTDQNSDTALYLNLDQNGAETGSTRFFTWFIIFAGFVPISLLVSMEIVKFWQGLYISVDGQMAYLLAGEWSFARAQTSGLNEELGQVQFVLSDKTGTLTCNSMDFRKCVIGARQYGTGETDISLAAKSRREELLGRAGAGAGAGGRAASVPGRGVQDHAASLVAPHVNFNARRAVRQNLLDGPPPSWDTEAAAAAAGAGGDGMPNLEDEFLTALAACNSVFPTREGDELVLKSSSPDEEALVEFARHLGYELHARDPPSLVLRVHTPEGSLPRGSDASAAEPERLVRFEQLALLDFTSKRKRMSVVLRGPDGRVHVYTKGADSAVAPLLRGANGEPVDSPEADERLGRAQPNWGATVQHLVSFGDQGLRTLLVASSSHDAAWWDDPETGWGRRHADTARECAVEGPEEIGHFKGACRAKCRRCEIERQIEQAAGLDLVGATAIEDKLQDRVPETVSALLDAGMSVWVLTGDKLETAINIGMACNLLESSMEAKGTLLRVEATTLDGVEREVARAQRVVAERDALGRSASDPLGLVVTSRAFARVLRDAENLDAAVGGGRAALMAGPPPPAGDRSPGALARRFWSVATRCKSVVGCRMQPNQKAEVVRLVKRSTPDGVVTLAVGDGANDEQMIREAAVGVGIRGVEGTTAVRASDYAISQFHFLRRLLLVHGRLSYRRIATLICYIFYKNSMVCFTTLWFGFVSGFSGQPIVQEWAYQLYNVAFTALPVLVFAVYDRDIEPGTLMRRPRLYALTSGGQLFNARIFWRWMAFSLVESVIVFVFPFLSYRVYSADSTGQGHGMWSMGLTVYTCVVLVANLKLALQMRSWTWLHHLVMWGSIATYFFSIMIINSSSAFSTAGGDYYYVFFRLMGTSRFWLTVILTVSATLLFDFCVQAYAAVGRKHHDDARAARDAEKLRDEHPDAGTVYSRVAPRGVPVRGDEDEADAADEAEEEEEEASGAAAAAATQPPPPPPPPPPPHYDNEYHVHRQTGYSFAGTSGQGAQLGFPNAPASFADLPPPPPPEEEDDDDDDYQQH